MSDPQPKKRKPAEPQPDDLPKGAAQFSIGLFGPHPVPLTLTCAPTSKRDFMDMLHELVNVYYKRCANDGIAMHEGAPVIHIASKVDPKLN
jgi:hypothetical protein